MTIRPLIAVLVTLFAAGCANPLNQRTAENYYTAGERAVAAGNLPLAKQNFSRALINVQIGHLGPVAESQAARKLAQILGNLCEYDDAEKTFLIAVAAEESAYGSTSPRTFPTRLELAQFNFDVGRFDRATGYYEKAFSVGGPALEAGDPLSYARLLDDYAIALAETGNAHAATAANTKAASMRERAKDPSAGVVKSPSEYVPYPKSCARQ